MALGRPSGTKKVPIIRLSSRSSTIFGTPTFARTRLATVSRALGIRGVAREPQRLGVELERHHDAQGTPASHVTVSLIGHTRDRRPGRRAALMEALLRSRVCESSHCPSSIPLRGSAAAMKRRLLYRPCPRGRRSVPFP